MGRDGRRVHSSTPKRQYEKSQGKYVCDENSKTLVLVTERKFVGDNMLNHLVRWFECHPKAFHLI